MALPPSATPMTTFDLCIGDIQVVSATFPEPTPTLPFMLESVMVMRTKSLLADTLPMISSRRCRERAFRMEHDVSEDPRVDQPHGAASAESLSSSASPPPKHGNAPAVMRSRTRDGLVDSRDAGRVLPDRGDLGIEDLDRDTPDNRHVLRRSGDVDRHIMKLDRTSSKPWDRRFEAGGSTAPAGCSRS